MQSSKCRVHQIKSNQFLKKNYQIKRNSVFFKKILFLKFPILKICYVLPFIAVYNLRDENSIRHLLASPCTNFNFFVLAPNCPDACSISIYNFIYLDHFPPLATIADFLWHFFSFHKNCKSNMNWIKRTNFSSSRIYHIERLKNRS